MSARVELVGLGDALTAIYRHKRCAPGRCGEFERKVRAFCRMALGEDVCARIDARREISSRASGVRHYQQPQKELP